MALRSSASGSSTSEPTDVEHDDTLGSSVSAKARPESREKRVTAGILAGALAIDFFLPWWIAMYPMLERTPFLTGWQLFLVGFGIGELPALTGFNPFGNFLFGGLPTLTTLTVAVMWLIRAVKPRALSLRTVGVWSVFALLVQIWLLVLGWARLNATMGAHPATVGLLFAMMLTLFSAVAAFSWWRRGEKLLWQPGGQNAETEEALAADEELFSDAVLEADDDAPSDDEPITMADENEFSDPDSSEAEPGTPNDASGEAGGASATSR